MTVGPPKIPHLWINGWAFAARVLRGGRDPWEATSEMGVFCRELKNLLQPDMIEADAASILLPAPGANPDIAIETWLTDASRCNALRAGVKAMRGAALARPLAIGIPGPGTLACRWALGRAPSDDDLDDAAVGVAQLIRTAALHEVDLIVITETHAPALPFYRPIVNTLQHQRLACALVASLGGALPDEVPDVDIVFGDAADVEADRAPGLRADESIWLTKDLASPATFAAAIYAEIPRDFAPERALERLNDLRTLLQTDIDP